MNQDPLDVGILPCREYLELRFQDFGVSFHMGKLQVCTRVFVRDEQDISIWGYVHRDYVEDCGAH